MTATESLGGHVVNNYDDLSVTVTWDNGYKAPIVRGMPYATIIYTGLTPVLKFGHTIVDASGVGQRFEFKLDNGQTWIVYTSSDIR